MFPYLVNILLLCVIGFLLLWYKPSQRRKKVFCILASAQWVILSGLRHISIGADTYAYKINRFDITLQKSWESIFINLISIFKAESIKDPGYPVIEKTVQIFTSNYQVYLIIIALIFTVSLGHWIYKNSSEPLISFLIYSCLFYSFFAITGHRQTIATALVVFIGYKFIKTRNFFPFLLIVLIAFTIHKSSVVFLLFYFIANKKITKRYLLVSLTVFIPILFSLKNRVMIILGELMGYEDFINQYENAGSWTFSALLVLITLVTIWKLEEMLKNNPSVTHYINALIMALVFVPLTFVDPSAMRTVQYFSLFIILLVPEIIRAFNKNERTLVYYIAASVLIGLFAKNNPQYIFFWQG